MLANCRISRNVICIYFTQYRPFVWLTYQLDIQSCFFGEGYSRGRSFPQTHVHAIHFQPKHSKMEVLLILLIIAVCFAVVALPLLVLAFYLLCKYQTEKFLQIRGVLYKYFLIIVSLLFAEVFVPMIFLYTYFYVDSPSNGNKLDKTNEYFLLIHQTLFVAINISALVQRYYQFSKFKKKSWAINATSTALCQFAHEETRSLARFLFPLAQCCCSIFSSVSVYLIGQSITI